MIAYKLMRRRRDGTLGSLFINRGARIPVGRWLEAELHLTKGYAVRHGWHVLAEPKAPHLMTRTGRLSPDRLWAKVEIRQYKEFTRPRSQGGRWFLARQMKILEVDEQITQAVI